MLSYIPVSVIIPAYNCELFLEQAVSSVMKGPGKQPAEIIIIDDCSTDSTAEVISLLLNKFPNVKSFRTETNTGAAGARFLGLCKARFEYSGFLDGDDWISPGAFNDAFETIKSTGAELCILQMSRVDDSGNTIYEFPLDIKMNGLISGKDAAHKSLKNWSVYTNGLCKTQNWIDSYEGIPVELFDSDELISRNLLLNSQYVTVCNSKYYYRLNQNSSTSLANKSGVQQIQKTLWLLEFGITNSFSLRDQNLASTHLSLALISSLSYLKDSTIETNPQLDQEIIKNLIEKIAILRAYSNRRNLMSPKILLLTFFANIGFSSLTGRRLIKSLMTKVNR